MDNRIHQRIDTTVNFIKRDLKTRYADSILGPLWIIFYPLTLTLIASTIFSVVFRGTVGTTPYILYVLTGFTGWVFFSQSISSAVRSLINNREIIANNKFPTETVVVSVLLSRFVDYIINLIAVLFFFFLYNRTVSLADLGLFFFVVGIQLLIQTGIALMISAANVYYRDIQNIMDIALQLLFYATPVIYPISILPERFRPFILLNPLARLISMERNILFGQKIDTTETFILFLLSLLIVTTGYFLFKRMEEKFAENI